MKITNDVGEEIEVFTADEVTARESAAATAKEAELKPQLDKSAAELLEAKTALGKRANEFAEFRKLRDEDVAKLDEKDRIIYENQLKIKDAEERRVASEETTKKAAVAAVIKAKAGEGTKLAQKMTEMWDIISVAADTPEQIEAKALMVLGAISTTTPDLLSSANGFSGGAFLPPQPKHEEQNSFADTENGKQFAADLGLVIEAPKK